MSPLTIDLLAMTSAVRLCMEGRHQRAEPSTPTNPSKTPMKDPIESILELTYLMTNPTEGDNATSIEGILSSMMKTPQSVLQELDIQRLRAVLYRDVVRPDRHKSGKNLVVVAVISSLFAFVFRGFFIFPKFDFHRTSCV